MNKVNLNTISLNSSSLNAIGEVKMGGASGGGGLDAIGVFIYDINGKLTAPEDWDSANNDKAVGVYVGTDTHRFVVAKTTSLKVAFGGYGVLVEGAYIASDWIDNAIVDLDGVSNTKKIITTLNGYTDEKGIVGAPACEACANYTFPNGRKGYLGSAGEWQTCILNIEILNNALLMCGGVNIIGAMSWVSTQRDKINNWLFNGYISRISNAPKDTEYTVRPFLKV